MNLYLHLKCFFFNAFKLLFTTSKAKRYSAYRRKMSHGSRHRTYSIKVRKTSEPAGT